MQIKIRKYLDSDFESVKKLYGDSGWFDPETDSEFRLKDKISRNESSILVAI